MLIFELFINFKHDKLKIIKALKYSLWPNNLTGDLFLSSIHIPPSFLEQRG